MSSTIVQIEVIPPSPKIFNLPLPTSRFPTGHEEFMAKAQVTQNMRENENTVGVQYYM
jgi:hypothetical protein